jgi:hypothetical protein
MNKFNETGILDIPQDVHDKACSIMASFAVSGTIFSFLSTVFAS